MLKGEREDFFFLFVRQTSLISLAEKGYTTKNISVICQLILNTGACFITVVAFQSF